MNLLEMRNRIVDNWNPETRMTMITHEQLDNLEYCIGEVVKNNVEGDFIETGVWRGGACIYARHVFKELGENRKIYVADSFEGLPKPNAELYPADSGDNHWTFPELAVSVEEVKKNFEFFEELDDNVIFIKGLFKDTLPECDIEKISVLRLDGDMYESTMDALVNLYDKLSIGGYCIVDDYNMVRGCTIAIDQFRERNGINDPLLRCQEEPSPIFGGWCSYSVYWKKTK